MKGKFDAERRLFERDAIEKIPNERVAAQRREIFNAESQIQVIRQGEINGWKSHLSSKQSELIDERLQRIFVECSGLERFFIPSIDLTKETRESSQ